MAPRHRYSDAWGAGFFDGEGSLHIGKDGHLRVAVTQNILWPLELLQERFGGVICNDRGAHAWRISGEGACKFLVTILRWLTVKRRQAQHKTRRFVTACVLER